MAASQYYATGRRKTATARVFLRPGSGAITVNHREFADFFLGAWSLFDVLEMNFEHDLESSLDFFTASSEFYPYLDSLCRQRVIEHFQGLAGEDDAED